MISNADAVICVYEFLVPYTKKMGANNIEVMYNKVDLELFSPTRKKAVNFDKPSVISVGRLIKQKNHAHFTVNIIN